MLDAGDADHERCTDLLSRSTSPRVVPAPVLVELDHFVPTGVFGRFLDDVRRGAFQVLDLGPNDYDRVEEVLAAYADLRIGFVDAAVLAVVERLGEPRLATLDRRHFTVLRTRGGAALELLPDP